MPRVCGFSCVFDSRGSAFKSVTPIQTLGEMSAPTKPVQRNRPLYGLLAALVMVTGLLWRSDLLPLSSFLAKYGGDSLWALLVFLCFGFAFRRRSTMQVGVAALCFAWS